MLGGERGERRQWREVALHAEHAVGQQQAAAVRCALRSQQLGRVADVVVTELEHARAAYARARQQRVVAELV